MIVGSVCPSFPTSESASAVLSRLAKTFSKCKWVFFSQPGIFHDSHSTLQPPSLPHYTHHHSLYSHPLSLPPHSLDSPTYFLKSRPPHLALLSANSISTTISSIFRPHSRAPFIPHPPCLHPPYTIPILFIIHPDY